MLFLGLESTTTASELAREFSPVPTDSTQLLLVVANWIVAIATIITLLYLRSQIKGAREVSGAEFLLRLNDRYDSKGMVKNRHDLAKVLVEGLRKEPPSAVLDFFETVGLLTRERLLKLELVWQYFGWPTLHYWQAVKKWVEEFRQEEHDQTIYAEFEYLSGEMMKVEQRRRGFLPDLEKETASFLEDESRLTS